MFKADENSKQRLLLPLDLLSVAISLLLAIYIRFHKNPGLLTITRSYNGLYFLILALILVIYIAVFFLNDFRHKPLIEQDPFEKTVYVITNQLLMLICLICLLYLIRVGYWASRAVVIMLFIFSTVIDTVFRFLYGNYLKNRAKEEYRPKNYLLLTDRKGAKEQIEKILQEGDRISEVILTKDLERDLPVNSKYDEILIYGGESERVREFLKKSDRPCRIVMSKDGVYASADMLKMMGEVPAFRYSRLKEKAPVLGVNFTVTNLSEALSYIRENIEELKGRYICFGNVHTTVMAHEDSEYLKVQNNAVFTMPDGVPIQKEQRKKGYVNACRVAGPDFMGRTFVSAMDGQLSMYFYGSTEDTIKALKEMLEEKYPGMDVRGYESPPFRELTEEEDNAVVDRINRSGADIVWVGLGAPKQEKWMAAHEGRIRSLLLGVGAGFDFHAGTIKRAPVWVQRIGLEWLYRLIQDPKRLLKRYVITNIKFIIYSKITRK